MVAFCNVCPGATKAIVWFKFADDIWKSYKPNTFPFSYEIITGKIIFYAQTSPTVPKYQFKVRYERLASGGGSLRYFDTGLPQLASIGNFFYGQLEDVQFELNTAWFATGYNQCKERIFKVNIKDGSNGLTQPTGINPPFTYKARNLSAINFSPVTPITPNCGCPNPWDKKIAEITGQGTPQIQIYCTDKICPPDTACQCDCGKSICCYDEKGIPVYSYLK
jgi:hypothetical protein